MFIPGYVLYRVYTDANAICWLSHDTLYSTYVDYIYKITQRADGERRRAHVRHHVIGDIEA